MTQREPSPAASPSEEGFSKGDFFRVALIAVAYFTANKIGQIFPDTGKILSSIWPASGVGLASLLLIPRRLWPYGNIAIFVAGNLGDLLSGLSLSSTVGYVVVDCLESTSCAWLITRLCGTPVTFNRVKEIFALLCAATIANACTASISAGIASLTNIGGFWVFWATWYVSNGLGILIVAPLIVSWSCFIRKGIRFKWRYAVEAALCIGLWSFLAFVCFHTSTSMSFLGSKPYLLLLFLCWAAIRLNPPMMFAGMVIFASIAVSGDLIASGPLTWGETQRERQALVQLFLGVTAATGFLLATSYQEKKDSEQSLRLSEKELREAQANMRVLINSTNDLIWSVDLDFRLLTYNEPLREHIQKVYGTSVFLGARPEDLLPPDRAALFPCLYRQVLDEGSQRQEYTTTDGRELEISLYAIADDGKIIGVSAFGKDITERKRLEEQLIQSQKMESIGRLAGGVAHDFNNMLSVIIGSADMLKLKVPQGDPRWDYLEQISKAAERSGQITRQLLALSRKQVIAPKTVNLNSLVQDLQKNLARLIGEDVRLAFKPAPGLWDVLIDPSQVDQIIMNLSVNARDAMPGGGSLTIETSNIHIDSNYTRMHIEATPGDYVSLRVADTGSGMSREIQTHIFEPFFTTKEIGKGTGLGLATVYGIVTQNKGFINVYSEPGQGTVFQICLPRHFGETVKERDHLEMLPPTGSGTILVVEDEEMLLYMTTKMLEEIGYRVIQAASPKDAMKICEGSEEIDLVLTDVVMPEMNGRELVENIRSVRPGIRVLFMSGYTSDIIVQRGIVEEGMFFIEKPLELNHLNKKIKQVLSSEMS